MSTRDYGCQDSHMRDSSAHSPRIWVLARRTVEVFRLYGLPDTLRQICSFTARKVSALLNLQAGRTKVQIREEVLGLQAGDLVEVKSEADIRRVLDASDRTRGLGFMDGMARHCGKRYRVFKPVRTIILEGSGEVRTLRNTVLLEGVICDGERFVCDRSCFYFWKESWLRRVTGGEAPATSGSGNSAS